jgi:hypothetical protein
MCMDQGSKLAATFKWWRRVAVPAVAIAIVSGCAHYEPAPGATSRIKFVGKTTYAYIDLGQSCATRKKVHPELMDSAPIPDGKRIHVEHGQLVYQGTCTAAVTFVPSANTTYVSEYETDYRSCRMNVYRLGNNGTREPEPTLQPDRARGCL